MVHLYLEAFSCDNNSKTLDVPLETFITYGVHIYSKASKTELNFVLNENVNNEPTITIDVTNTQYKIIEGNKIPKIVSYCALPSVVIENMTLVSGLCSVARQLIKFSEDVGIRKLLGFREACLMACNESSIWTKFCEIDMVQTTKELLKHVSSLEGKVLIPRDLTRFECHMACPVRIHNVYKVAQDQAKSKNKTVSSINTKIPKENLDLQHAFSEGPFVTLADTILYLLIQFGLRTFGNKLFRNHLPLTFDWYQRMSLELTLPKYTLKNDLAITCKDVEVVQEEINKQSLYVSDPQRYQPKNRIYTKQPDILNALNLLEGLHISPEVSDRPFGHDMEFDWSQVPLEANPEGGALPESRSKRKSEQLENLAKAVIKISKSGHTIVDFCSGSGHLGILLAVQLPQCHIILLENKEISLNRARERVLKLHLQNITLLQSNLDYFIGNFDIGVSLHACGVATDLVIQQCLRRRAAFISCPCCYGGVHVCHHIFYPRSQLFRNSSLTLHDYLVLGHAADQTHDSNNAKTKQGVQCMDIIDMDRKLQAEENGYYVVLSKMKPETCSPKNNLLVGFPNETKM